MASSLPSFVDNLTEGPHNDNCIDCKSCFDQMLIKDNQIVSV